MRLILASKSPARYQILTGAGLLVEVIPPDVDESEVSGIDVADLVAQLATLKARQIWHQIELTEPTVVFGCDSMLEFDGLAYGKPGSAKTAISWWQRMRRRQGVLHTGHHIRVWDGKKEKAATRVGSTLLTFADLSDQEITDYASTGEPERVAGGFTIDGYGGPFITQIVGDPHNVVGISLPLVRQMLFDLGVPWTSLWTANKSS